MRVFWNFEATPIRLTNERVAHILARHEGRILDEISDALLYPDLVIESLSDSQVWLYRRRVDQSAGRTKRIRVVVKHARSDAFVLTAYPSDRLKRGRRVWPPAS